MKVEEWNNVGRDHITIGDLIEMEKDGYEFVVRGGHIVSVMIEL